MPKISSRHPRYLTHKAIKNTTKAHLNEKLKSKSEEDVTAKSHNIKDWLDDKPDSYKKTKVKLSDSKNSSHKANRQKSAELDSNKKLKAGLDENINSNKVTKIDLHEDEYNNTDLSYMIEEGEVEKIRELLQSTNIPTISSISKKNDVELLKDIAIEAKRNHLKDFFQLSEKGEWRLYYDVKDQLDLMGADISDLLEDY